MSTRRWRSALLGAAVLLACAPGADAAARKKPTRKPARAAHAAPTPAPPRQPGALPGAWPAGVPFPNGALAPPAPPPVRYGRDVIADFRAGLSEPTCDGTATSPRWRKQFAHAPGVLAAPDGDALPLFGYVVASLREAHLPTEFALIPFVESGYKTGVRNGNGPAGLWQFVAMTARNHDVRMVGGYDGRLSPVDSTRAAVRYLKTLNGMFGGDWRMTVMAYNAGENRVLQSMRRAGMNTSNARHSSLQGLSPVTVSYVEKLHALACLLEEAPDSPGWSTAMALEAPVLAAVPWPADARTLDAVAADNGVDAALLARLNPALANGPPKPLAELRLLVPVTGGATTEAGWLARDAARRSGTLVAPGNEGAAAQAAATTHGGVPALPDLPPLPPDDTSPATSAGGAASGALGDALSLPAVAADGRTSTPTHARHVVGRGETASTIARRYGMSTKALLAKNGLKPTAVLRVGATLAVGD